MKFNQFNLMSYATSHKVSNVRMSHQSKREFSTHVHPFSPINQKIKDSDIKINNTPTYDVNWDEYFQSLTSIYKRLTIDQIIGILYKVTRLSSSPFCTSPSTGIDQLLTQHSEMVEYLIHKLNINFKHTGDRHLQLFTAMGHLNERVNGDHPEMSDNLPDNTRMEIFRLYNRSRRVLSKGDSSYYVEVFKQNAPLRKNIIGKDTEVGGKYSTLKNNQLFKILEFMVKNAFMNPFGSRIERLHPLKIEYHPDHILSSLAMLMRFNDQDNDSLIDLLISKLNDILLDELIKKPNNVPEFSVES